MLSLVANLNDALHLDFIKTRQNDSVKVKHVYLIGKRTRNRVYITRFAYLILLIILYEIIAKKYFVPDKLIKLTS